MQEGETAIERFAWEYTSQALYHAKQEGRTEGRTEAVVASIKNLMDSLGLSMEQSMSALKVPEVDRARYRELLNIRDRASHDEAQALYHAEQKGIQIGEQRGASRRNVEVAKSLLKIGLPLDQIAEVSGLTLDDIKELGQ